MLIRKNIKNNHSHIAITFHSNYLILIFFFRKFSKIFFISTNFFKNKFVMSFYKSNIEKESIMIEGKHDSIEWRYRKKFEHRTCLFGL